MRAAYAPVVSVKLRKNISLYSVPDQTATITKSSLPFFRTASFSRSVLPFLRATDAILIEKF
jgi:hypothetical protein